MPTTAFLLPLANCPPRSLHSVDSSKICSRYCLRPVLTYDASSATNFPRYTPGFLDQPRSLKIQHAGCFHGTLTEQGSNIHPPTKGLHRYPPLNYCGTNLTSLPHETYLGSIRPFFPILGNLKKQQHTPKQPHSFVLRTLPSNLLGL